jgi:uncharacterized protein
MKIVLDANVIISAFATRGLCESVMEVCLSEHDIVLSDGLLDEILINLRNKIKLPSDVIINIETLLRDHSHFSNPVPLPSDSCRDSDDIKILGLAVASNADYIVTGDKDLLVLNKFQSIPVISPRTFYDLLHNSEG